MSFILTSLFIYFYLQEVEVALLLVYLVKINICLGDMRTAIEDLHVLNFQKVIFDTNTRITLNVEKNL